jgi:hypothetical protein
VLNDTVPPLGVVRTPTNTVVVWWQAVPLGWNIQQNTNLSTSNWIAPSEPINNNGTNKFIIVNPPSGSRFYRLMRS